MGGKGSGRYAYTFSAKEARNKLGALTPAALRNIKRSIEVENNVENSKWLMQIMVPRTLTAEETAGALTTLADVAKLALKTTEDTKALRNITPNECNGVCDSRETEDELSKTPSPLPKGYYDDGRDADNHMGTQYTNFPTPFRPPSAIDGMVFGDGVYAKDRDT